MPPFAQPFARRHKVLLVILLALTVGLSVFFFVVPPRIERNLNPILQKPPYTASARAVALHQTLQIVDLHADSLLWGRDLRSDAGRGQVDVPKLLAGNVALQVFTTVTKSPRGLNIERNTDESDNIFWLAVSGRWPPRTWFSLKARALYQAQRLHQMAADSKGTLTVIRTQKELAAYLTRRRTETRITAGMLGIEGAHALEGDPANVEVMADAGFRYISPSHFFDTAMGGSAHGVTKGGLTQAGRDMIRRMEARCITLDLAHAAPQTFDEALKIVTRPVIISHTGVKGTCNNTRNLSDEQLKAVAAKGGLVGIGFWDTAVCGTDARSIARAFRYAANLIGVERLALGSDFDGSVAVPFDASGLVLLTDALLQEGFSDTEIANIMGGNALRFFAANLPE